VSSCENDSVVLYPGVSSSPPLTPPKKSTTYPKMSTHQIWHHQCSDPGIDSMGNPHPWTKVYRTYAKDSHPKPTSELAPVPSGTRISWPPDTGRSERPWRDQYNPVVWPCNEPGLSSHWTQSVPLPLPRPPKKKIHNPPKNVSPWDLPSPVYLSRHRSHSQTPIHKSSELDYCKWFIASDRVMTSSRTCISSPLVIVREQRRAHSI
jgi:hypothetical protein